MTESDPDAAQEPDAAHPGGRIVMLLPLGVAMVSLGLLFLAIVFGWLGPWTGTGSRFCEASRPGLIRQPVNTWSNLGFVFAGLAMARHLWRGTWGQNANALTRTRFYGAFFPSLTVFIGPCSMAMHATETVLGGWLDLLSMHLIAAFIAAFAIQRFRRLGTGAFLLIFTGILTASLAVQEIPYRVPVVGHPGNLAFAAVILTGSVMENLNTFVRRMNHSFLWGLLSSAAIITAFVIWNLSMTGCPLCNPYSAIQGHGLWHLLCAVSLYCLFRYYVSERPRQPSLPR